MFKFQKLSPAVFAIFSVGAAPIYSVVEFTNQQFPTSGFGMNNLGQVVGSYSNPSSVPHPFLYSAGVLSDLAGPSSRGTAVAINDAGQITGQLNEHAFLYSNGDMLDLGTFGGLSSRGAAINVQGQVTGFASLPNGDIHAFIYTGGIMNDIGGLRGGGRMASGSGVNNQGEVVGASDYFGAPVLFTHAFLYSGGVITDLGTLGGPISFAKAINDNGQIVGSASVTGAIRHAVLYQDGMMQDLGTLAGGNSDATSINASGDIVGNSDLSGPGAVFTHAFLYSNGVMIDLNASIDPGLGVTITSASAINDLGQILAGGVRQGRFFSTLILTPVASAVPEPSNMILTLAGLILLVCAAKRQCARTQRAAKSTAFAAFGK